jgi:transcriptional antiterminator RfaH
MADAITLMNARSRLNAAPSRRWYVAQSHVHAESKAAMHLGRQGFEVYLPRYRKQRRHARRIDVVAAPLFPHYLFVSIDLGDQRWQSIQSTIGITRLVGKGDEPGMVSPAIIEGLRDRPGDQVRISDGAFWDCLGLYEGISGDHRCAILLDLLGRKVRVVLDSQVIEAA